jgi:hypothetical protein
LTCKNIAVRCISFIWLFTFSSIACFSQVDSLYKKEVIDSLRNIYGKHKTFITEYEPACLMALSFYPELIDEEITFISAPKESTSKTTMTLSSIFRPEGKHFIIYVNDNRSETGVLLRDAPFSGRVGVIGHELAHVVRFRYKDFGEMVLWGFNYLIRKKRIQTERNTDLLTIQHGLGKELYTWALFIQNSNALTHEYKKMKMTYYMHPDEIKAVVEKY